MAGRGPRSGPARSEAGPQRARPGPPDTPLAPDLVDEDVAGESWRPELTQTAPAGDRALPSTAPSPSRVTWWVAVDELIDFTATLRITPWPVTDERGRLRFPQRSRGFTRAVDTRTLRRSADRRREIARPVRIGDVFALLTETQEDPRTTELAAWDLVDATAAARQAAKSQYFAAVAPVLEEDEALAFYGDLAGDEDGGTTDGR